MAMRTFFSSVTLAACGIFSLAALWAEKKDLTIVPAAFKEKVARAGIGAGFGFVQPKEGVFNWEKADRYLDLLERSGLAVNTIVYSTPRWATDGKHAEKHFWQTPTKRGFFRNFGEKLTARYGMRIAWYEVGNEWDLLTPEQMTTDEATELQREANEGLKAGCPAAKVIPNGWAMGVCGGQEVLMTNLYL